MIEVANREIREARTGLPRRRLADRRGRSVMAALDGVLGELEALSLAGVVAAPSGLRARVADLVRRVFRLGAAPPVPGSVRDLMDAVYATQDAALMAHRRTAFTWRPGRPA